MSKKFVKNKENFICEHCKNEVIGNGYTNHCPKCLWSKHVDINPGDRQSVCGGMMKPLKFETTGSKQKIINKCIVCGHEKANVLAENDNWDQIVDIQKGFAKETLNKLKLRY